MAAATGIDSALWNRLSGYAGLIALTSTRIYPLVVPQGAALPCVSVMRFATHRETAAGDDPGLVRSWVQVSVWAATHASAIAVAAQVQAALQRHSGSDGTVTIQDMFLDDEQQLFDSSGTEANDTYHIALDFECIHTE